MKQPEIFDFIAEEKRPSAHTSRRLHALEMSFLVFENSFLMSRDQCEIVNYECFSSISNVLCVLNVVFFILGDSPASEFYMPTFRNTVLSS